jgi:phosphoserine phosphatase RsbU/P
MFAEMSASIRGKSLFERCGSPEDALKKISEEVAEEVAGHAQLLLCREGRLERIESNGLLFGVMPEADSPIYSMHVHSGDRFLLYTDGLVESENSSG